MRQAFGGTALVLLACTASASGQSLVDRILAAPDGTVRLEYAVREGICGDGETFIRDRSRGENNYIGNWSGKNGWRSRPCDYGPGRVVITKSGGSITRMQVLVGGEWRSTGTRITDLGVISAPVAARALVALAARERRAKEGIFGAIIADSAVVWPDLLALAKNTGVRTDTRKDAIFWLSQEAGDAATKGLAELADDDEQEREVREQAVFALSQLPADQGVPILIRVARSNRDPQVRRKALFWLGQSDDPRALELIEEILTKG
jgi:hypothetical protein